MNYFEVESKLTELLSLPDNWNSYRADPINPEYVRQATVLLHTFPDWLPTPEVVPLVCGGVQFEWHRDGVDLEISINGDGTDWGCYTNGRGTIQLLEVFSRCFHRSS